MNQVYKIKKAFRVPFLIAVALLFVLLTLSFFIGQPWEKMLLAVLSVITLVIAVEASEREFAISENGLRIRKFFRTKNFTWSEITHLGIVVIRNKAYFLLTTTKGFYLFSNLLQDHTLLIRSLADKLGDEKVETEVRSYLETPIERTSMIILTWIALGIIVAIILTKLIKF
ncbi:MAG: hypothetical protein CVU71_14910 [Deltaproteobacteria bacterium HGW-Deltaproteobacteria-6]|nr:MAG: hypothetical protein CVU71_14910 [Deltaproteobacteria bacterium HGW-Deltaproteobacteria-6]